MKYYKTTVILTSLVMSLIASLTFNMIIYSPPASAGIILDDEAGLCLGNWDCDEYEARNLGWKSPCGKEVVLVVFPYQYFRCTIAEVTPPNDDASSPSSGPSSATTEGNDPLPPPPLD